ncbi:hypothetical protein PUN28_001562 [Cardiocondyla obscurior]|uniref:Ribosome biogenesis protein WDR12 homolog n=1 Tax=Cardiocondyla obscurior TaxID=286306 RepID=A0AAW2H5V7_9HYME
MEVESVKKNRLKTKSKDKSRNKEDQVHIRFVTKLKKYVLPDSLTVDSSLVPDQLNTLLNEVFKANNIQEQGEFDFLISSCFLRSSLSKHFAEWEISTEKVVEVEFVEKHPPPKPKDCLIHDDWVSAVDVCEKWILTGSYDNMLHIWSLKGQHQLTIPGHTSPLKAVAWISLDDDNASFVSASMDQTCMIWSWDITRNTAECVYICEGHRRGIEAIGINHDKSLLASGAWDTMLYIWSIPDENDGESVAKKGKPGYVNKKKTPKCGMKGHKQAISGIVWSDKTEIITSSWDHTIKIWDAELNGIKHELHSDKSFFDIDYSPLSRAVITGSADQHVRLFDPRSTGIAMKTKFTSHTQWIPSVRWSTVEEYLFISGAYDNIVKLWDTRSIKVPLFDLLGHDDKVLNCNWSNPELIMSGGADNTLRIFKSNCVKH